MTKAKVEVMDTNGLPGTLNAAMRKMREVLNGLVADIDVANERRQLQLATAKMETVQAELDRLEEPYRKELRELEGYISGQVMEHGGSIDYAGIEVKHVAGYSKTTWVGKKVAALVQRLKDSGDPDDKKYARRIEATRKVSDVKPRVTFKY